MGFTETADLSAVTPPEPVIAAALAAAHRRQGRAGLAATSVRREVIELTQLVA
jgi:hypothetical protein